MTDHDDTYTPPDDCSWSVACDECWTARVTFPHRGPWFTNRQTALYYAGYHHATEHPGGDPVNYPQHWPDDSEEDTDADP